MSNLTREFRGVDRIAGELLGALPDVAEALERFEQIRDNLRRHMGEFREARQALKLAELALQADLELLADELSRDGREWRLRREEIERGAADLGLLVPTLGFRIVHELPKASA